MNGFSSFLVVMSIHAIVAYIWFHIGQIVGQSRCPRKHEIWTEDEYLSAKVEAELWKHKLWELMKLAGTQHGDSEILSEARADQCIAAIGENIQKAIVVGIEQAQEDRKDVRP